MPTPTFLIRKLSVLYLLLTTAAAFAQPKINSFSPASGTVGSTVTISGTGFGATPAGNTVYFGAVKAPVTAASATSLTVTVPAGATYEPVSVLNTTNGLSAYASKPFVTTFSNPFGAGITGDFYQPTGATFTVSDVPYVIFFSDVDGDGKSDLIAPGLVSSLAVLHNVSATGSITAASFEPKVSFNAGSGQYAALARDLDGDGKPDLVAGSGDNNVAVLRNRAVKGSITAASFESRVNFPVPYYPQFVDINDLDLDGKPDIITASNTIFAGSNGKISLLRNVSAPGTLTASSFTAAADITPAGTNPTDVQVADIDQDGKPDIVFTSDDIVYYLRNISTPGTLLATSFAGKVAISSNGGRMRIIDVDGDAKPDVLFKTYDTLTVIRNIANGGSLSTASFSAPVSFALTGYRFNIADLDGDGKPDVLCQNPNNFSILRNTSVAGSLTSNSFAPKVDFETGISNTSGATVGDVDGDGIPEVVVTNTSNSTASIFKVASPLPPVAASPVVSSFSPVSASVGATVTITGTDFNAIPANNIVYFGAVRAPVVSGSSTSLRVTVPAGTTYRPISVLNSATGLTGYSSRPFTARFTNPFGTVIPAGFYQPRVDINMANSPGDIHISDFDGDGKPDLLVATTGSGSVFRNISATGIIGPASFAPEAAVAPTGSYGSIAAGDVDGDGKPDIVGIAAGSGNVVVLRNVSTPGNLSFNTPVTFAPAVQPDIVKIADLDGDGKPDLLMSDGNYNIVLLRNVSASGTINASSFSSPVRIPVTNGIGSLAVGDVDGDGKPDVVISLYNTIAVLHNVATRGSLNPNSLAAPVYFDPKGLTNKVVLGDLNGDGKPEIVSTPNNTFMPSHNIVILQNTSTSGTLDSSSFAGGISFPVPAEPSGTIIGDVDGDGRADVVTFNSAYNTVSVLQNNITSGNISSTSFAAGINFATNEHPIAAALGDLDNDNLPELVVSNIYSSTISLLKVATLTGTPGPAIVSFDPASGPAGTAVTISGYNFNSTPAGNVVYFGAVKATVTTGTANSLTVTVPAGATYQPISVLNTASGLTGYAANPFVTTFANPFGEGIPAIYFNPRTDIASGSLPYTVAIGDIDGDGKPDLVEVDYNDNKVSVRRNISVSGTVDAGSFAAGVSFATGANPYAVTIGDADGDGKPDLVVTNHIAGTISVLRNTSTPGAITASSFQSKVDFLISPAAYPFHSTLGDIDGDGKPELVVANYGLNTISVLRNTTSTGLITAASFAAPVSFSTGSNPRYVLVNDLDGDGKADVAVANEQHGTASGTISLMRNTAVAGSIAASSLSGRTDYQTGGNPVTIAAGDLNSDGKPDLVTCNEVGATLTLFQNTSTPGTLDGSSFVGRGNIVRRSCFFVSIADADGDGHPDLLTANSNTNTISVFRNLINSTGYFAPESFVETEFAATGYPVLVTAGDLNGDGKPEFVTANAAANTLSFFTPSASAVPVVSSLSPAKGPAGTSIIIGGSNFNMAAASNIVYFGAVKAQVTSSSTSSLTVTVPAGATYQPLSVLNVANGLTGYSPQPFVATFTNPLGTGIPAAYYRPKTDYLTGTLPFCVATADLDGDGKPDIVNVNKSSNTISVLRNTSAGSNPSFAAKVDFATGQEPLAVVISDVTGDGKPDIVVANSVSGTVSVLRNLITTPGGITTASFAAKADFVTGSYPFSVAVGDLDFDGKPDLAVVHPYSGLLSILHNTSAGNNSPVPAFQRTEINLSGAFIRYIAISDLDGDGKKDLIMADYRDNALLAMRNTTTFGSITPASFALPVSFQTGAQPVCVATGDIDGDGKPDLVTSNFTSNTVSVLRNTATPGNIAFAAKVDYATEVQPFFVSVSDADGDGKEDLLTANAGTSNLSVLRNLSTPGNIAASSFANRTNFAAGGYTICASMADLDGDGVSEAITANAASNSVSIFKVNTPVPFVTGAAQRSVSPASEVDQPVKDIQIYPNPASGVFALQLSGFKAGVVTVAIIDLSGKKVQEQPVQLNGSRRQVVQLSLEGRPAGVYYVKITGVEGVQIRQILIKR